MAFLDGSGRRFASSVGRARSVASSSSESRSGVFDRFIKHVLLGASVARQCSQTTEVARLARRGPSVTHLRAEESGFTLIEILVVIVVIAVLAGLVAPNVFKHV